MSLLLDVCFLCGVLRGARLRRRLGGCFRSGALWLMRARLRSASVWCLRGDPAHKTVHAAQNGRAQNGPCRTKRSTCLRERLSQVLLDVFPLQDVWFLCGELRSVTDSNQPELPVRAYMGHGCICMGGFLQTTFQFIDSIHWFDSLIRFIVSIHWFDSLIRFIVSIHWLLQLVPSLCL